VDAVAERRLPQIPGLCLGRQQPHAQGRPDALLLRAQQQLRRLVQDEGGRQAPGDREPFVDACQNNPGV